MAKQDETILIALDYLLNYTDENHMSNATEINNYALDTYGISIDHRCVNKFLAKLKDLCDTYPDKFPFILESNDGIRPRYYIEQKYLSREDILSIASAIKDTFQIDPETSQNLIETFVDVTTNHYQKAEIMNIISSQPEKGGKIKATTANVIKKINQAINEKRQITYRLKYDENSTQYTNYFYKIIYIGSKPIAIVIRDGQLASYYVKDIKIIRMEESWFENSRCRFQIKDAYHGSYANPEEEIAAKIVPNSNPICTATCCFSFKNKPYCVETIKESFESFFHKKFEYSFAGGQCFAKITTKIEIFLEWATQYHIAKLITVTGNEDVLFNMEVYYKDIIYRNKLNKYKIEFKDENERNNSR